MGLYAGQAQGSFHPSTGRWQYPGKITNRAARIASGAAAGQVLASQSVVEGFAAAELGVILHEIGAANLKGVAEPVTIVEVTSPLLAKRPIARNKFQQHTARQSRATSRVMRNSRRSRGSISSVVAGSAHADDAAAEGGAPSARAEVAAEPSDSRRRRQVQWTPSAGRAAPGGATRSTSAFAFLEERSVSPSVSMSSSLLDVTGRDWSGVGSAATASGGSLDFGQLQRIRTMKVPRRRSAGGVAA